MAGDEAEAVSLELLFLPECGFVQFFGWGGALKSRWIIRYIRTRPIVQLQLVSHNLSSLRIRSDVSSDSEERTNCGIPAAIEQLGGCECNVLST